jgi:DNA-binding MarR family transcriptional regulator
MESVVNAAANVKRARRQTAQSSRKELRAPSHPAFGERVIPAAFQNVVGYHLRIAQEGSFRAFEAIADKVDLKPGWYALLTILAEAGALTPSELSRVCGRDRSTLTGTMKVLSARGLVQTQRNPEDQRSYVVKLTPKGREMLSRLHSIAIEHERRLDNILGKNKSVLLRLLRKVAIEIEEHSRS